MPFSGFAGGMALQRPTASSTTRRLFYGWGLGLAETLAPWRVPVTIAAFLAITIVIASAAHPWLRRFPTGPVERRWRVAANVGARDRPSAASRVRD